MLLGDTIFTNKLGKMRRENQSLRSIENVCEGDGGSIRVEMGLERKMCGDRLSVDSCTEKSLVLSPSGISFVCSDMARRSRTQLLVTQKDQCWFQQQEFLLCDQRRKLQFSRLLN